MFRRFSPRDLKRLMRQFGMKMEELKGVKEVVIELEDKRLIIEDPQVVVMTLQDQTIIQVVGTIREEEAKAEVPEEEITISDEDVQLVASQTGVSLEEAKRALIETKGDLAQAIMLLETRKQARS